MNHWNRLGGQGIKGSGDDHLSVIVDCEIAESSNLDIHDSLENLAVSDSSAQKRPASIEFALLVLRHRDRHGSVFHRNGG